MLEGKLESDPNLEFKGPHPKIMEDYQRLKEVFEPYLNHLVLVQIFDRHKRKLLLGHSLLEVISRKPRNSGGNFYLTFYGSKTGIGIDENWFDQYGYFSFSVGDSPIARVVASDRTIIYQDKNLVEQWDMEYLKWSFSVEQKNPFKIILAFMQKAVTENLLKAYKVYPSQVK